MQEVQKEKMNNIEAVLKECRSRGVTIDDLLGVVSAANDSEDPIDKENIETIEEKNIKIRVSNLLKEIGIPAHIKGYHYVRYSIIYVLENPEAMEGVTKVLYPAVARKFGTTSSRVERAIRHAVEVAWERGDTDVLTKYFAYTVDMSKGKPTNSEFIAMLADYLELN